jgi:uridine monophosphate synthetase
MALLLQPHSQRPCTLCHQVPGAGIIDGLKSVGKPLGRGLLLLAEMSSAGTLAKGARMEVMLLRSPVICMCAVVTHFTLTRHCNSGFCLQLACLVSMVGAYTEAVAAAAAQHEDFVVGFISVSPAQWGGPTPSPGLIHMTPGVQLQVGACSLRCMPL